MLLFSRMYSCHYFGNQLVANLEYKEMIIIGSTNGKNYGFLGFSIKSVIPSKYMDNQANKKTLKIKEQKISY